MSDAMALLVADVMRASLKDHEAHHARCEAEYAMPYHKRQSDSEARRERVLRALGRFGA